VAKTSTELAERFGASEKEPRTCERDSPPPPLSRRLDSDWVSDQNANFEYSLLERQLKPSHHSLDITQRRPPKSKHFPAFFLENPIDVTISFPVVVDL
jgi:hypothetical protein